MGASFARATESTLKPYTETRGKTHPNGAFAPAGPASVNPAVVQDGLEATEKERRHVFASGEDVFFKCVPRDESAQDGESNDDWLVF